MSFPRYPKYKDSGVEWLGQIPDAWQTMTIKRFSTLQRGHDLTDAERTEGAYPVVTSGGISGTHGSFMARGPGVVTGRYGSTGRLFYIEENFWPHNTSLYVSDFHANFPRFVWYSLQTVDFASHSGKAAIPGIDRNDIHVLPAIVPPIPEQTLIASFLDVETSKIDSLIAEQRRLIELLKEKRQAVISHAVTKGLNPNAPMKPSGIEWLGDVPEHWSVTRLCYYATVENGTTPSRDNLEFWSGGDIPWLSSGEVNQYRIVEANEFITKMALDECSLRLLPKGTIVTGMIGQSKTRGLAASLEIEATINQNLAAIVPKQSLESDYLLYIFQSVYEYLREFGRGGNQAALNCEILSALMIPLPQVEEQTRIRSFLDERLRAFDALTAEATHAINLLQERRTAVISAAVTGKIDVREFVSVEAA